jgi:3-oxoacyl-[acyl-carrier protein] reductase
MLLSGKNAVVTGCLRGIGKSTLEIFAEQGANVWACAQQADEEFGDYCNELAARTGTWIKPVYFDLTDTEATKAGLKAIISDKKPVDVLVNVAGFTKDAIFQMTSIEQLKLVFEVNFFSQILISQYITKLMVRQKRGSIINIASISGLDGSYGQLAYSSSKAALIGATRTMSRELAPQGIRVNALAPGVIDTDMNAVVPENVIASHISGMSIKRMGSSQEVANAILFLASDLSSYMTGQIIRVDGGMK